jgi:rare lipoprotein A
MKSFVVPPALLLALHFALPAAAATDGRYHSRATAADRHGQHSRQATLSERTGMASYYRPSQRLASGMPFHASALTAAHRTLPFGTRVRIKHLGNGRWVDVRINDRGPYIAGRIIDLSKAAADVIGMTGRGIARVSMTVLGR